MLVPPSDGWKFEHASDAIRSDRAELRRGFGYNFVKLGCDNQNLNRVPANSNTLQQSASKFEQIATSLLIVTLDFAEI